MASQNISSNVIKQLAPHGVLRAAINMSNLLLVTGKDEQGDPEGVSPDMAKALAKRLGVGLKLLQYATAGDIADDAGKDCWDICNIGDEPKRAKTIDFSKAYSEIQATYMVMANSSLTTIEQVDKAEVKIAVSARSAYGLWLERNIKQAQLCPVQGYQASLDLFVNEQLDALAGLRSQLINEVEKFDGARVLNGHFTSVQQAMGCNKGNPEATEFIKQFVEQAKASGLVNQLINQHNVAGRLTVAE